MSSGGKKDKSSGVLPDRSAITDFLHSEATGGVALMIATGIALIWANLGGSYFTFFHTELTLGFGPFAITEDLHHWINDALMTLFFFVVALEIKRELVTGELRDRRAAALPVMASLGGVILPALIFFTLIGTGEDARGWAIPVATDIAFAVGVLALLGNRIPTGVKVLLLTIAIVDDIIAIVVIAVFYSTDLSLLWLLVFAGGALSMIGLRAAGVVSVLPYIPLGVIAWFGMYESGVHATMAGVVIGLITPARPFKGREVLDEVEHALHPFTSLLIVPLFALANAGIIFDATTMKDAVTSELAVAIAAGLIFGKLLGIGGTITLYVRLGLGSLPVGVRRAHVWGVAALGGIGFTVSLFIAQLSYADPLTIDVAKIGIFSGSFISAILGITLLLRANRRDRRSDGTSDGEPSR